MRTLAGSYNHLVGLEAGQGMDSMQAKRAISDQFRDMGSDGLKALTVENWLTPDPVSTLLVELDPVTGQPRPIPVERWAELFLQVQVGAAVPDEVRTMFEVGRNALVYGGLYQPLYTLGTQQLYRVADAATWYRCRQLGKAETGGERFVDRVRWLVDRGAITDGWWWGDPRTNPETGIRRLRNETSHATQQYNELPGAVLPHVQRIATEITALFEQPPHDSDQPLHE